MHDHPDTILEYARQKRGRLEREAEAHEHLRVRRTRRSSGAMTAVAALGLWAAVPAALGIAAVARRGVA